jgi:L-asparagine oxygenase
VFTGQEYAPKPIFAQAINPVTAGLGRGESNTSRYVQRLQFRAPKLKLGLIHHLERPTMSAPLLFSSTPQEIELSPVEMRQLAEFGSRQRSGAKAHDEQRLLADVQRQPIAFPSIAALRHALVEAESISYLLVENLAIDLSHLPRTPRDGVRPAGKTLSSECALLQTQQAFGLWPVGYEEECSSLIHQIAPVAGQSQVASSAGKVPLGLHTDLAILRAPFRPHFLSLVCLRNEARTPTLLVELEDALTLLHQRGSGLVEILHQPRFVLESPPRLRLWEGKRLISEPRPLLEPSHSGREAVAANLDSVRALDREAEDALLAFKAVLHDATRPILLRPGSMLIFNNLRVLHGRAAIRPGQRWLQRVYSSRCLDPLRHATNSSAPNRFVFQISQLILD